MTLDKNWIAQIRENESYMNDEEVRVYGVPVEMPIKTTLQIPKNWQRRVLADLIPDSPMGDAPEKILFRASSTIHPSDKSGRYQCLSP